MFSLTNKEFISELSLLLALPVMSLAMKAISNMTTIHGIADNNYSFNNEYTY